MFEAVRIGTAIVIAIAVTIAEISVGGAAHSTSLILDGLHVAADLAALLASLIIALVLWRQEMTEPVEAAFEQRLHRFGSKVNARLLIAVVIGAYLSAVIRFIWPHETEGELVFWWALGGLGGNIIQRFVLTRCPCAYHRSIQLHIMSDMWTSITVIIGGAAVALTGWNWLDPLVTIGMAGYISITIVRLFEAINNGQFGHHH
ncbi:MAG: cation transporter [bacterium]|nr:cation transporter [bacterium]